MPQKRIGVRRAVISGTLGRWIYTVCQAFVQLAIVPVAIQSLGVETYGLWLSVSAIIGWLSITDPGMGTTLTSIVTRDIANGREKAAAVTIARCLVLVVAGLVCTLAVGIVAAPIVTHYLLPERLAGEFVIAIIISVAAFVLNRAVGPLMAVSVAELENIYLTSAQVASAFAQLAVCLICLRLGYGVIGLAAGSLARSVVLVVPMLARTALFLRKHDFFRHRDEGRPARELVHLAAANYPAVMISVVTNGLDVFLIGMFLGGAAAAAYSVNGRPLDILASSSLGLTSALMPVYARQSAQQPRSVVAITAFQMVALIVLASVAGFGAFVATSAAFVTLWAGPETIGSAGLVFGLATAVLLALVVDVLMQTAMADARHLHELSFLRVGEKAAKGIVVAGAVFFAPLHMIPWAVAGLEAVMLLVLLQWMKKKLDLFRRPLDQRLLFVAVVGVAALGTAAAGRSMVPPGWPSVIAAAAFFGLGCVALCLAASSDYRKVAELALKRILGITPSAAGPLPDPAPSEANVFRS